MSFSEPLCVRVYFHVIRHSNGIGGQSTQAVNSAFEILNEDYADHNISFVWNNQIDYIDNDSYYSSSTSSIFNVNNHSNGVDIYLFSDDVWNAGGLANGVGNSSEFYVGGRFWESPYYSLVTSHVISHEMGHVLFLWHTHHGTYNEGGNDSPCKELVNGSNCSSCGDYICDTPADPHIQFNVDNNCQWLGSGVDANGNSYKPDTRNIMSYSIPTCMGYFSEGQGIRMRNAIQTLPYLQQTRACAPDLLIRDDSQDTGIEPNPRAINWNSPDIKLLYHDNDNEIPFGQVENESLCRVAVNVKNISNQASLGNGKERLHIFWRKPILISRSIYPFFPRHTIYFGEQITQEGGLIIPYPLQHNEERVVAKVYCNLPDNTQFRSVLENSFVTPVKLKLNWGFSIMAIADEGNGGIPELANTTIPSDWAALAKKYNSIAVTNGNRVLLASDFSQLLAIEPAMNVPFSISVNQLLKDDKYKLNDFAELYVLLSNDLIANFDFQKSEVKQIDENRVYLPSANTELYFKPVTNEEGYYFVGSEVHFISDKMPELNDFDFDLSLITDGEIDETVRITAIRDADVYFKAQAEASKTKIVRA
ncbi:MAG: hypothetical protein LBT04_08905, partial [Prevotellaceae bacterium]|nr:hypothetical protein [Prevotellaceae bacterium]